MGYGYYPCKSYGLIVNAWMPLPEPYKGKEAKSETVEEYCQSKGDRAKEPGTAAENQSKPG